MLQRFQLATHPNFQQSHKEFISKCRMDIFTTALHSNTLQSCRHSHFLAPGLGFLSSLLEQGELSSVLRRNLKILSQSQRKKNKKQTIYKIKKRYTYTNLTYDALQTTVKINLTIIDGGDGMTRHDTTRHTLPALLIS